MATSGPSHIAYSDNTGLSGESQVKVAPVTVTTSSSSVGSADDKGKVLYGHPLTRGWRCVHLDHTIRV